MDTVLNLGMNDTVVHQLASCTGNPRFAFDTYRRFLQMYGSVVLGVDKDRYQVHYPTVSLLLALSFCSLFTDCMLSLTTSSFHLHYFTHSIH